MHLTYRGVNDAFFGIVKGIHTNSIPTTRSSSRNGDVLYVQEPVIITYTHPREKVLFNAARDANPAFHLYEALWMLAGRNDVESLAYYNSRIAQYSDDGQTFNGAYGYRWRHAKDGETFDGDGIDGTDQLKVIINHLRSKPDSRRAVLSMWNVESDLLKINDHRCKSCKLAAQAGLNDDGGHRCVNCQWASRDVCCNLSACFSLRDVGGVIATKYLLDLTVFNRSNDLIWGTLGANAVHFAFLLEYMAAHLGVEVGVYSQVSNNQHVYLANWKPDEWLTAPHQNYGEYQPSPTLIPLVKDPATFDRELPGFVERHSKDAFPARYAEPFLRDVAQPMCIAWHYYKNRDFDSALSTIKGVLADDWRLAGTQWLERRAKREAKRIAESLGRLGVSGS